MSIKHFEHFICTEAHRHPILSAALHSKTNLRKCSQQFENAVSDLHYRLIKAAVQLLFSRISSARAQEISSAASSTCETKYVLTETSPASRSGQATDNGEERWDAQSNNSQGQRHTSARTPTRSRAITPGQQQNNDQGGGGGGGGGGGSSNQWVRLDDSTFHHHGHRSHQPSQSQSQPQHRTQQRPPSQPPPPQPRQPPQQAHICQQDPRPPPRPAACAAKPNPQPRPQPVTREGPSYSYPTAGHHNRRAMAGWYVANMDALLSNLMRLFEMIYRDTLQICGVGVSDLRQLRNALPDPTLISMQQRASGAWRPNYMNCKIDFLLHIAAMVYRNTQDLRRGCTCSVPADPCWPGQQEPHPASQPPPPPPPLRPQWAPQAPPRSGCCNPGWASSGRDAVKPDRNNHWACDCQAATNSPMSNSPQPLVAADWDQDSPHCSSRSSPDSALRRDRRREGRKKLKQVPIYRSKTMVELAPLASCSASIASEGRSSIRSGSNSSSTADSTSGNTCLDVCIKM